MMAASWSRRVVTKDEHDALGLRGYLTLYDNDWALNGLNLA